MVQYQALGLCKLCWHNFEHSRQALAFENYAGIIDRIYKHYYSYLSSGRSVQHVFKQELPKYVAASEGVSSNVDNNKAWLVYRSNMRPTYHIVREHVRSFSSFSHHIL